MSVNLDNLNSSLRRVVEENMRRAANPSFDERLEDSRTQSNVRAYICENLQAQTTARVAQRQSGVFYAAYS